MKLPINETKQMAFESSFLKMFMTSVVDVHGVVKSIALVFY